MGHINGDEFVIKKNALLVIMFSILSAFKVN